MIKCVYSNMHFSRNTVAGIALTCAIILLLLAIQAPAFQRTIELPRQNVRLTRDVTYATVDGKDLKLDIYEPATKDRERPVVVYIHGGGWFGGDKSKGAHYLIPCAQAGYVGFSINYRLSGEAHFPAQIYDCKAAIRWVRKHAAEYGGDGARIGVFGMSAGGHLVALLGTSNGVKALEGNEGVTGVSSNVQAICDWFGPADLTGKGMGSDARGMVARFLGAKPQDAPDVAKAASPVTYIDRTDPPFLIIHGVKDPLVPIAQSRVFRDRLAAAKVSVQLIEVPGGKHGNFRTTDPNEKELIRQMLAFFNKYLHR
jgi:acetyl esterase/lipase